MSIKFPPVILGPEKAGVARAPVAIINFAFLVQGLLIESYINLEIFCRDLTQN